MLKRNEIVALCVKISLPLANQLPPPTQDDVRLFLESLRIKMETNAGGVQGGILIAPRRENRQALATLDISAHTRWQKICELKTTNFCQLLESDKPLEAAAKLHLWVFGVKIRKTEVYIKIQFGEHNDAPVCISFHPSAYKLEYLFS